MDSRAVADIIGTNSKVFLRHHPLIQMASERDGLIEMEGEGVVLICNF